MPTSPDSVTAAWDPTTSTMRGVLAPQGYGRRVVLMTISGPGRSTLEIYRDYVPVLSSRITRVYPADARTWSADGSGAIDIPAHTAATFIWSGGTTNSTTSAATASLQSEVYT